MGLGNLYIPGRDSGRAGDEARPGKAIQATDDVGLLFNYSLASASLDDTKETYGIHGCHRIHMDYARGGSVVATQENSKDLKLKSEWEYLQMP